MFIDGDDHRIGLKAVGGYHLGQNDGGVLSARLFTSLMRPLQLDDVEIER